MPQPHFNKLKKKYSKLALGGTFDHLHKGHRFFFKKAFSISEHVTIGITSDDLAQNIHQNQKLQPFTQRKIAVNEYLSKHELAKRVKVVTLNDHFGPTIEENTFEALLVTTNTLAEGKKLNIKRKENNLKSLEIIVCKLKKSEDGLPISSQRIRNGEISRDGVHYLSQLLTKSPLKIPKKLRKSLRKPFGKIFPPIDNNIYKTVKTINDWTKKNRFKPIISVGDEVTHSFLKIGVIPQLKIVDLRVQRKSRFKQISEIGPITKIPLKEVKNPAGSITTELINAVHSALKTKTKNLILVEGEEDLAAIPAMLLAPLGSVVIYGHFQFGIIAVKITDSKKSEVLEILNRIKKNN